MSINFNILPDQGYDPEEILYDIIIALFLQTVQLLK